MILLLTMATLTATAGTPDGLFYKFRYEKNAEYVHIPRLLMSMAKTFYKGGHGDEATERLAKSINSVRILDLDSCSQSVQRRFRKETSRLSTTGYEQLLRTSDGNDNVQLLLKQKDNVIKEIFIIAADGDGCALVQIKGSIQPSDIDCLVAQYSK